MSETQTSYELTDGTRTDVKAMFDEAFETESLPEINCILSATGGCTDSCLCW